MGFDDVSKCASCDWMAMYVKVHRHFDAVFCPRHVARVFLGSCVVRCLVADCWKASTCHVEKCTLEFKT